MELDLELESSLRGKGTEMAEKLKKRKMDIRGLQKVQWRGQRACFIGVEEKRYKIWWLGNDVGKGGVETLVKEKLC